MELREAFLTSKLLGTGGGGGGDELALEVIQKEIGYYSNSTLLSLASYAFFHCSLLSAVSLPALQSMGQNAFGGCSALEAIDLPACTGWQSYVFDTCIELSYVRMPAVTYISYNRVSKLPKLRTAIFYMASTLLSSAFTNCYTLLSLYLLSANMVSTAPLNTVFSSTPIYGYTASTDGVSGTIYVPSSLLTTYQTGSRWSAISDRFVGLTDQEISQILA